MIHLCTCTGGSTSTISSRKRRRGTVSCKNCGGRPAIDGQSSSSCLLNTVLELTSLINSDFTWIKVSKGCRSSSRRPRRSNTNNLACGELLTEDSKHLDMPISESEKLGVSLLGCHFSEKAEHIPIKKRRFLFSASSTPRNNTNPSFEGGERNATCPKDSYSGLQLSPSATCLSEAAGICQRGGNNDKLDEKELLKTTKEIGEDDDFSGISILAEAACNNNLGAEADLCEGSGIILSMMKNSKARGTVEVKENNAKSVSICKEESDSHTSTTPAKVVAPSTNDHPSPNESMLDASSQVPLKSEFSNTNPETSMTQKSTARDVRLNWDLNTVMDAWDEPFVSKHEVSTSDAAAHHNVTFVEEKGNDRTKDNSGDRELGSERESGSPSKTISSLSLPVELKSLAHENEDLKLGNQISDGYVDSREPLFHDFDSAQHAGMEKTASLHDIHIVSFNNALTLTSGLGWTEAVNTQLSMDCSIPPGFDHCLNFRASKENAGVTSTIVGPGNNVKFPTTTTETSRSEFEKHDLSLSTTASLENGPHQSGVTSSKNGGEAGMKMELTSDVIKIEDLDCKGTDLPQGMDEVGPKSVNQKTFGAVLVSHSSADDQPATISSMRDAESPLQNGFRYDNSQSDNRGGSGNDKLDEISVEYDSQYEDGELRESTIHAWKGYEGNEGENEYVMDNKGGDAIHLGNMDVQETSSQCGQEGSSGIKQPEIGSGGEADLISNVLLSDKHHSSEVSGSGPIELISGQGNSERQDTVQHASQLDEWKMNVSRWDALPENHITPSNNFAKTRNLSSRNFSYREQKDGFETEAMELKAEGSRFYRKESITRIGGSSAHDAFLSSDRFRMQGCSSKAADGLTSRSERKSGALRSFGRGRYSPQNRGNGRGGGMWNRSPKRGRDPKRLPSPSYQGTSFFRSTLEDVGSKDNMANETGMDPSDPIRPNTRRSFRSRSPRNKEAIDYRSRFGLRPTRDTNHDRIVNMDRNKERARFVRYGPRPNGEGPRGRYQGPASDEFNEFPTEYSHPFPRRRQCFSPVDRRGNSNSYAHHQSDSRSPSRPRTRSPIGGLRCHSRSPNFRPDTRMQRLRSPNYRRGFEPDNASEYNSGPRNNNSPPPPSSRWVYYKDRSTVFDRRSPPPGRTDGPPEERFRFHYPSRKPKQNEYCRSGHLGRFPDLNEAGRDRSRYMGIEGDHDRDRDRPNNGFRGGGFIRRYDMDGPAKRFRYEDEDGFGRDFDSRGNSKPCNNGTDSRFRDFPRRPRDREPMLGGEYKRRSRDPYANDRDREREPKEGSEQIPVDDFQRRPGDVKEQSTTNIDLTPNEVVKESDDNKPVLGSN